MRAVAVVAVALALSSLPAVAHVSIPTAFKEVVRDASLIVRGRITDVRSIALDEGGADSIATVAIESVIKGRAGEFVYVRVPGGTSGSSRFVFVGAPTFRPGQRAIYFLKPGLTDPSYRPVGLTMGIFRVQAEPRTGRPVVEPPLVSGRTASSGPVLRGDPRRKLMPVPEFESLVRVIMAATPASAIRRGGGR